MQIPPPDAGTFDPAAPFRLAATAVRRAWPRMLAFFVVVMGLAFVGLAFAPREYGSEAKLFVRVGRESIGLDPTATTGQTFSLQESRKTEINSVLDVITTREVFERVADRVGPEVILEQGGWSPADPIFGLLAAATGGDGGDADPQREALEEREKAVRVLFRAFDVSSAEESSVIDVTCRADSPELARTLLTEFLGAFQSVYLEMFRSGSFEFFEEQVALLGERHDAAGERLRDAKDAIEATTVEGRRTALQHQLEQTDDRLLLALAERDAKTAERTALREAIAALLTGDETAGAGAAVASGSADDAADALRKQVDGLRLREQELLASYTERHPDVAAVRDRLAAAETLLAAARGPGDASAVSTNPTLQGLHLRALEEQAAGEALDRRIQTIKTQREELLADLKDLNAREAEIERLQRETDLLAAKYGEYSERLEQARMNRELADGRITNVKVAQPPTLVFKPVSPNKPLVAILAFLLASGGAVALGLLSVLPSPAAKEETVNDGANADEDPVAFEPEPAVEANGRRPTGRPAFAGAAAGDGTVDLPR
ncbi:GumC family protein [Alienimonas sp. DA493]|uniref:GumC family protein n=1 Tax=Alienimonas sp. DA493 TaxID=3373605 RepID=UPI003754E99C